MKRVAFFSGPAWEKWDASSPTKRGIGGSETCLVHLSEELVRLGHEVELFIDCDEEKRHEGVRYIPYGRFPSFTQENYDFLIHFRNTRALPLKPKAKCHIGFAQDIQLGGQAGPEPLAGQLDYLFGLSQAHLQYMSEFHRFPLDRILMTANAVDPSRYLKPVEKVRNRIFYSSCPSRDLDILMMYGAEIAQHVPDFELVVAYGMQTWEGLLRQGRGDYRKYFFTQDALKNTPWIKYLGRIDQNQLAELQMSSRGWFYPTQFPETFCITAAEAGFARCPILTSSTFGLETTVGDGGIVLRGTPGDSTFGSIFVAHAVRLLTDDRYWEEWSDKAHARMRRFTWGAVARQWHEFFESGRWQVIQ